MKLYNIFTLLIAFLLLSAVSQAQEKKEISFRITILKSTGKPQQGMILKISGKPDKYISDGQGVFSFKTEIESGFTRTASIYFPTDERKSAKNFPLEEKETNKTFYIDSPEDLVNYKQNNTTVDIEGIVKDTNGHPIKGATVSIQGTGRKTTTDDIGLFKIGADYSHPIIIRADGMENSSLGIQSFAQHPNEPFPITMYRKDSNKIYSVAETMPEFPGGMKAFKNYLDRHLQYPAQAKKEKKEGVVAVQFIVERDGRITSPTIVRSLEASMDSAAITLIRQMPRWIAGKENEKNVRCKYSVPIQFKIAQPKQTAPQEEKRKAELRQRTEDTAKLKETIFKLCGKEHPITLISLAKVLSSPAEGLTPKHFNFKPKK